MSEPVKSRTVWMTAEMIRDAEEWTRAMTPTLAEIDALVAWYDAAVLTDEDPQ